MIGFVQFELESPNMRNGWLWHRMLSFTLSLPLSNDPPLCPSIVTVSNTAGFSFTFLKGFYVCRFFIRATFSCHRLIVKLIGSNKSDHVTSIIEYHSASKENFCLLLMNQRLVGIFTCHSPVQPVFVVEPFVIPLLSHCDLETVFLKQQTLNLEILFLNIFYPKYFARFHQRHSVQMKTKKHPDGDYSLDNETRQFCPYHFNIIDFGKTSHEDVDIDKSSRICKKIKNSY